MPTPPTANATQLDATSSGGDGFALSARLRPEQNVRLMFIEAEHAGMHVRPARPDLCQQPQVPPRSDPAPNLPVPYG